MSGRSWRRRELHALSWNAGLAWLAGSLGCARPRPAAEGAGAASAASARGEGAAGTPSASGASTSAAAPAPPQRFPHGQPIVSFATSPDGRFLATGAEATPDHADDAVEGVALWDLADLSVLWRRDLRGGVGFADQLQDGVAFSADGRFVGANYHTSGLAVLDAATGRVACDLEGLSNDDGPIGWRWGDGDALVVMGENGAVFTSVAAAATAKDPRKLPAVPTSAGWVVDFDGARAWLVDQAGAMTFLSRDGASTPGPRLFTLPARAVALSRDTTAFGTEKGQVVLLDRATGAVRQQLETKPVEALRFSAGGALAIVYSPSGADLTRAAVLRGGRLIPIDAPLARHDWMSFADGVPLAIFPARAAAGAELATISPAGEIQVGALGAARPSKWIATVAGATSLVWPTADRLLALGPGVVAAIDPQKGVVVERRA